jgi:hypothetical protein
MVSVLRVAGVMAGLIALQVVVVVGIVVGLTVMGVAVVLVAVRVLGRVRIVGVARVLMNVRGRVFPGLLQVLVVVGGEHFAVPVVGFVGGTHVVGDGFRLRRRTVRGRVLPCGTMVTSVVVRSVVPLPVVRHPVVRLPVVRGRLLDGRRRSRCSRQRRCSSGAGGWLRRDGGGICGLRGHVGTGLVGLLRDSALAAGVEALFPCPDLLARQWPPSPVVQGP